jgi:hypothetical protein
MKNNWFKTLIISLLFLFIYTGCVEPMYVHQNHQRPERQQRHQPERRQHSEHRSDRDK